MADALSAKKPRTHTFDVSKADALARWLGTALGGVVTIEDAKLLGGGAVQENWRLDVTVSGGALAGRQALVLRTDGARRLPVSIDRDAEVAAITTAAAVGVPVAAPIGRCTDDGVIGRPFLVQHFIAGISHARQVTRHPELAIFGAGLARELGRLLARIHAVTPADGSLSAFPIPIIAPARAAVARVREPLAGASQARPALDYCLAWLDANAPTTRHLSLVHGDYRTGNYLLDEHHRVAAVLDWEFAHWGDPMEDIGWICARCWRFGNDAADQEAGGIGPRRALYDGYNEVAAVKVDEAAIPYWEVMAASKWAVLSVLQGDRFLTGGETSIELALTGLMAAEMEFDALEGIAAIEAGKSGRTS